ncbi:DNA polymerase IV [Vagococcus lutrae]|uniref:DNA polymerase IV n=1 Tax=Vagococcus lutrae TaxID=81947 RepID=UPI001C97B87C|nr:DNA polymerase IV [Vagococcus lutrae]MDT2806557.1 DNA polymerase IV [Vagococcus lutrae]MDT2825042.1 DNA polymerase IV [Vagococcus lutrae]QZN87913.1 DNA polymerase IV [Vagococcus lutrae]
MEIRIPLKNDTTRKIIHIDMDAFYASIEERDRPELRGKPLVIARHPKETNGRGVVTTANYEARQYGIHSAMSAQKAYELCPHANFVKGDLNYYREVSAKIHAIFHRYTDMIEPLSLDEAYLDVTENKIGSTSAIKIATLIQRDIWRELHLTCSAGVSYNKFIAKLASDYQKPRGQTVVLPDEAVSFLRGLPIDKFQGVGRKTLPRMHERGIFTGEDLYQLEEMKLIQEFGKMGYHLYRRVRGVDNRPVNPNRERKSLGRERTFNPPLRTEEEVMVKLREIAYLLAQHLSKNRLHGQIIVLKVRNSEFETVTKRRSLPYFIHREEDLFYLAKEIWESMTIETQSLAIRLLGITMTGLAPHEYDVMTLPLYPQKNKDIR